MDKVQIFMSMEKQKMIFVEFNYDIDTGRPPALTLRLPD